MNDTCKWCEWSAVYKNPEDISDDEILTCYVDIVEHVKAGDSGCSDFKYSSLYPRI